ncbi:MAG: hypothetical protein IKL78_04705 [Lachnospiraceae bacterium]|nr:hypothetical protein [Lachnospiraceae bacterium]
MNKEQKMLFYSKAAMVLGIVTIVTAIFTTVYIPFITGGLSIIFAVISRGEKRRFSSTALGGIFSACVGIFINVAIIVGCFYLYNTDPQIREQVNEYIEQMTGQTLDEDFRLTDLFSLPTNQQ